MPELPLVGASVVICSRDRPAMLRDVIARILEGTQAPAEIVAIDQSAAPDTSIAAMQTPKGCRLVYHPTRTKGLSRGMNLGSRLAANEILIFTHDDVLPQPDWYALMSDAVSRLPRSAVVTGRVSAGAPEVEGGYAPSLTRSDVPVVGRGRKGPDLIHPMNLGMRRRTLEECGGWDPRLGPGTSFPGGEDHDLELRLRDLGVAIHYRPDIAVVHRAWRRGDAYRALRWAYGRGHGAFLAKHFASDDAYALRRFVIEIGDRVRAAVGLFPSDPAHAIGRLSLSAGMLAGAAEWLIRYRHRRVTRRLR
jgi:GT2 family glycosyltransferase